MKTYTSLTGCTIIPNQFVFDERGTFSEIYKRSCYATFPSMKQWNVSMSKNNVVRGLHFQSKNSQGKLVRVLHGSVLDLVVDLRSGSPTYGKIETFYLTPFTISVYIPVGFAHAFWALGAEENIFQYGCTEEYDPTSDGGINPMDPDMPYPWRKAEPVISAKDKNLPALKDFQTPFRFS